MESNDRDETSGVINQDVVDYIPSEKYDLIIGISTLEHVLMMGYDFLTFSSAIIVGYFDGHGG